MSKRAYVRHKPDRYTVSPYAPPASAVRLGESRMEPFVQAYQFGQQFSAATIALSHRPQPTLLDLAVSAYLQGIEDTVQSCTANGFNFNGEELVRHPKEPRVINGGDPVTPRAGGPHDCATEFSASLW